jgi:hypothetical protein
MMDDLQSRLRQLENAVYGIRLADIPEDTLDKIKSLQEEIDGNLRWLDGIASDTINLRIYLERQQCKEDSQH